MASITINSFCRACVNSCPTLAEVVDGRLERVKGDPANPVFQGYTCVKGRAQPDLHNHPDRLLHSLKRRNDGTYAPIGTQQALDEIAERLQGVLDLNGPRAVAAYLGTGSASDPLTDPFFGAFMRSIGSRMKFSPNTIDKPGKSLALAMHGRWMAPLMGYHEPDVALIFGANPFKSYYSVACGHPARWLREQMDRGMELLVVDPRRSDLAKRATLHVQPRPGYDPAILACLVNVVLTEGLYDQEFVAENARGLDGLQGGVRSFSPARVAAMAGVAPGELEELARRFATPARGYVACGVGPGFSKSSTLVEYLALVMETLCGHWMREGERVARTTTLFKSGPFKAQADDPTPAYGLGEVLRVKGLTQTTAGLPTGALADEILLEGDGRIRALFSVGGNPVIAWPDQLRTVEALRSLDLLVQVDPWMSATAREAHYVIAPTMSYETPAMTTLTDFVISMPTYYGPEEAYAQYTETVVNPPAGSDVIPEWELVYGLAQRLKLDLRVAGMSLVPTQGELGIEVDMNRKPSARELLESLAAGSRVPLSDVKKHPSGATFPDPAQLVEAKVAGWTGRFDLANPDMLRDLSNELTTTPMSGDADSDGEGSFNFRLISVRVAHMNNSTVNKEVLNRGRSYNPAYMHPEDLSRLGLEPHAEVEISSAKASIRAIVEPDSDLREGLIAMAHGFGGLPPDDSDYRLIGSPPARLLDADRLADPYVGMPQIGNIPVRVRRRPAK